jgi:hypothetical protein
VTWRYTWRPELSEFEDGLEGHDGAKLESVMEEVWIETWRP